MVERVVTPGRNVIDFADYQRTQRPSQATAMSGRFCRHCGAALLDDDSEDDCSSAGIGLQRPFRGRSPRRIRFD
ncbi:hypothetical protein HUU61_16820 [Rhodopseudomonas palustris]|uniref:Uncharacterized protein n=1 Tax=Rhodopseudomonas pseudopalustris TaxID=1513892 RepID=A0A1H8NXW2_9BRAD|nr:hypothetical protein [Rhodopseudomonas palustris]SEO34421.1 hypothetical protein SAMN05444123_102320 [Rhodopseudomonas pseudopalustris]